MRDTCPCLGVGGSILTAVRWLKLFSRALLDFTISLHTVHAPRRMREETDTVAAAGYATMTRAQRLKWALKIDIETCSHWAGQ
jgi:hypothetical protein